MTKYNPKQYQQYQNSSREFLLNVDDLARALGTDDPEVLAEAVTEVAMYNWLRGVDTLVCRDCTDPRKTGRQYPRDVLPMPAPVVVYR